MVSLFLIKEHKTSANYSIMLRLFSDPEKEHHQSKRNLQKRTSRFTVCFSESFLYLRYETETGIHGSAEVLRDLFSAAGAFDRAVVRRTVLGPSCVGIHIFLSHATVHVRLRLLFPFFFETQLWRNGFGQTPAVGNPFADGLCYRLPHHACGRGDGHSGSV